MWDLKWSLLEFLIGYEVWVIPCQFLAIDDEICLAYELYELHVDFYEFHGLCMMRLSLIRCCMCWIQEDCWLMVDGF